MLLWKLLKKEWTAVTTGTAWLFAAAIGALRAPPVSDGQFGGGGSISKFLSVALPTFGLLVTYVVSRKGQKSADVWWTAGVVALLVSFVAFAGYNWVNSEWTAYYNGGLVVIGYEFTPHGAAWVADHPEWVTTDQWIKAHAGKIDEIWTRTSINIRCLIISMLYILSIPCAALAIVCSAHAVALKRKTVRPRSP